MTYKKKLIEVALPLEDINREAARENYIYKGNPSAIHKWWAQRPLAACRAVLFSSLVDDPSQCVAELIGDAAKRKAAEKAFGAQKKAWDARKAIFDKAAAAGMPVSSNPPPGLEPKMENILVETERERLFDIIRELVKWENSNEERVLKKARTEILRSTGGNLPPVYDPFCGGGSIPLEAQRLGLEAHASDLNPVPVLINKALIEIPPRFAGKSPINPQSRRKLGASGSWNSATGLIEDIQYYGQWMRDEAERRIGHLYPRAKLPRDLGGGDADVIAWLWARTVKCPNPACGGRTPMVRSFWLSKKKGREVYAKPIVNPDTLEVHFEILTQGNPPAHTSDKTGARCLFCGTFMKKEQLRIQSEAYGLNLLTLAVVVEGPSGRTYLPANSVPAVDVPRPAVEFLQQPITNDRRWFSPPLYGLKDFSDLFTSRQLMALSTLSSLIQDARRKIHADALALGLACSPFQDTQTVSEDQGDSSAAAYAAAIVTYLAFALDKTVEYNCSLVPWYTKEDRPKGLFARHAMAMVWDFAELNPLGDIGGTFIASVRIVAGALGGCPRGEVVGRVSQADATRVEPNRRFLVSTDPPYYDNIGYAALSDFFYVWLRHTIGSLYPDVFQTLLTPKETELIAMPFRFGGNSESARNFFETGLRAAFGRICECALPDFPVTVFYAFKQTEADDGGDTEDGSPKSQTSTGWETMLEGLVSAGFLIDGTWPIRTERGSRSVGLGTNALASSIVLVCRQRSKGADVTSRRDFLSALKRELPEALRNLQKGNIAPVDLAQAAIGPGMAVFSRFARVLETDGSPMGVRTALSLINQSLDEVLAEQEGEFDADTRWALAWFDQYGFTEGSYGQAETLSTAKNTSVSGMVGAGILAAKGGKVRLLKKEELPEDWNPASDSRLTIWEATHQLIRSLDSGEQAAARLLRKLGAVAEIARDLSYRLYTVCERRKWSQEAIGYNALVLAWPDLKRQADEQKAAGPTQQDLI